MLSVEFHDFICLSLYLIDQFKIVTHVIITLQHQSVLLSRMFQKLVDDLALILQLLKQGAHQFFISFKL